jgi:hypothetical protein
VNGIKLERSSLKLELEFHLWIFCAMHFDCRKEKSGTYQSNEIASFGGCTAIYGGIPRNGIRR